MIMQVLRLLKKWYYTGNRRHCPVCGSSCRTFVAAGRPPRKEAKCPLCGALERHRLLWRFFEKKTDLFDGRTKRVLHIAPEPFFECRLKEKIGPGYLTADLHDSRAMVTMDITDIGHDDDTFDVIYCGHVLEHVPSDHQAMVELRRVLKTGGWAVIMVPITADCTDEDPEVTDPRERMRRFGQEDHLRRYGPDVLDRLRTAGFDVTAFTAGDFLDAGEVERLAAGDRTIFFCTK